EDLAFLPVASLSRLVRTRKVTSLELTRLYLGRLKRYDEVLKCVVNLTEDLALQQAARADEEIAAGRYRGPLHGIPWGAKDLIACAGYPTTWGAAFYKDQQFGHTATVVDKLNAAGAVLVAKLTTGALAEGDQWFGGMTRNPFFPEQGSSGSSAGPASAVAAGLVGFAIGSETLGSIVSPCIRCRATGLRPTFGRVSRYGCMPLSWTMDKLGPIARSVEDCAIVFEAIHGADGKDAAAVTRPFQWPVKSEIKGMRVGYFEGRDEDALEILRDLGATLLPIDLPGRQLANQLASMLSIEAAAAFDEVTAAGITDAHGFNRWKERFQRMRFVSAVDYIRANRLRSVLMEDVARATSQVDAWIGGDDLVVTNLTGHPTVVLPHGAWEISSDEPRRLRSRSITFTGQPYADDSLLALGAAFQAKGDAHLQRPSL
ncbi:MAG: amidase, partial [Verrucomicrobiae bacterium]|nr:amidase [Verrucomicrobiae bacterium]